MIEIELEEDEAQLIVDLLSTCPRDEARALWAYIADETDKYRTKLDPGHGRIESVLGLLTEPQSQEDVGP